MGELTRLSNNRGFTQPKASKTRLFWPVFACFHLFISCKVGAYEKNMLAKLLASIARDVFTTEGIIRLEAHRIQCGGA